MTDENPPADHVHVGENRTGNPLEENMKSKVTWMRGFFMLISWILVSVAMFTGSLVVVIGFFCVLFTGEVNQQVRQVGQSLATYIYQNVRFLTFNSDERPFPFGSDWPSGKSD